MRQFWRLWPLALGTAFATHTARGSSLTARERSFSARTRSKLAWLEKRVLFTGIPAYGSGSGNRLPAEVGGNLEGVAEELEGGNLGAGELGSLGDAGLEVGDLGDELHGALAGDEVVLHHAAESDHAKAAVLDLNNGAAVGLEAKGVEAIVAGAVELAVEGLLDEGDLEREEEGEHLLGGSDLDELVVKRPHLLAGVPLAVEGEGEKVLDDQSGGSEHGNAAVLDLSLASRRFPFFLSKGLPFLSLSLRVFPFSL